MTTLPSQTYRVFEKIKATCEREKLIVPHSLVVLGVSGGIDSMLLLAFLARYRTFVPFRLIACHVNHMIRGRAADLDESLVESLCKDHEITFVCLWEDVPLYAKQHNIGIEQAGRIIRRERLQKIGRDYGDKMGIESGVRVALAHHMDDRAESILMHMGRGAGLRGLIGIQYLDGPFIRPLLDIRRAELVAAAEAMDLRWREDESNRSDDFLRNRIRNRLLPAWEETVGYDLAPSLVRLGTLAADDDAALTMIAKESYGRVVLSDHSLSLPTLLSLPKAIASRVLQQFFRQRMMENRRDKIDCMQYNLSARNINDLLELSTAVWAGDTRHARLSLPGGMEACLLDGRMEMLSYAGRDGHDNYEKRRKK
ncbi:MAG TPA: tRNA lysidine(34) synthetase TilS [Clostridia bacterium]|nr:tRNA lysidine(34) synthetase TilS [Clostridia bacterium]